MAECPLLAQSGHTELHCTCPLSGVKRTWLFAAQMSAFDPNRTSSRVQSLTSDEPDTERLQEVPE